MKLTKLQEHHLESIQWLISDQRATGKTFLLAWAFIQKALHNRDKGIRIFDHFPERKSDLRLISQIHAIIISEYPQYRFAIYSDEIVYKGVEDRKSVV